MKHFLNLKFCIIIVINLKFKKMILRESKDMNKINKIIILIMLSFVNLKDSKASEQLSISVEDIAHDTKFLKSIVKAILERPQAILSMQEGMIKKHGQRSFELWRDHFNVSDTWGPAWSKLSPDLQQQLIQIFGSKDNAKMIMKREEFILINNDNIVNAQVLAKMVEENGTPVLDISKGNQRNPYTLVIKYKFPHPVGVLHIKKEGSSLITEQNLVHMYLVFNISDIINKILSSKKHSLEEKKNDWNKMMDGYVATFSATT